MMKEIRVFRDLLLCHTMAFLLPVLSLRGQSQVVGPSQPIVAKVGDDVILPCRLEPAIDASGLIVEWARPGLTPGFVYVRANSQEHVANKQPSYRGRTSVLVDKLKLGDVSLKLSRVKISDEGTYRCLLPTLSDAAFIRLVVGAVSSPVIVRINRTSSGLVLQCKATGWYPEPEVLWLDTEGNLLPAGPTETVRGPDDLYTVSSRVTVETTHNFTCRVQQKSINQTRETHLYVRVLSRYLNGLLVLGLLAVLLAAGFTLRGPRGRRKQVPEGPGSPVSEGMANASGAKMKPEEDTEDRQQETGGTSTTRQEPEMESELEETKV